MDDCLVSKKVGECKVIVFKLCTYMREWVLCKWEVVRFVFSNTYRIVGCYDTGGKLYVRSAAIYL